MKKMITIVPLELAAVLAHTVMWERRNGVDIVLLAPLSYHSVLKNEEEKKKKPC